MKEAGREGEGGSEGQRGTKRQAAPTRPAGARKGDRTTYTLELRGCKEPTKNLRNLLDTASAV